MLLKKLCKGLIVCSVVGLLVGCGTKKEEVIKVGLNGSNSKTWEYVKKQVKEKGINLELVYFSDYVQPNRTLVEKEIDINSFQTISFFNIFNENNGNVLVPVGTTFLAPMGIYSKKIESLDNLRDGGKVTIPNDASNQDRALKLLEKANIIELNHGNNKILTINDVKINKKNIEIIPLAAVQLPQTLDEVDISVINNGYAVDAGLYLKSALFSEDKLSSDYINIIVARKDNKDDKRISEIVKAFQTKEVEKINDEDKKGNSIAVFIPLSEVGF